ncbi:MAG: hypothetical protein ACRD0U_14250 [Acidimicrobiales bacterium]
MLKRLLRMAFLLTLVATAAVAVVKLLESRRKVLEGGAPEPASPWGPLLTPPSNGRSWIEPDGDACPASHPVKAKLSSGIFHLPGGLSYERTQPDRCYVSADAAEADGLRPAKR